MVKKIISIVLTVCMLLSLMPTVAYAAQLPDCLYVGGVAVVTDGVAGAVTSGVGWHYNVDTATLYLTDGAEIGYASTSETYLKNGIYCEDGTLNIHASGTVTITGYSNGIYLPGAGLSLYAAEGANVTITAEKAGGCGIYSTRENVVAFSGKGTVNVYSSQEDHATAVEAANTVKVDGVTLNVKGSGSYSDISAGVLLSVGTTEAAVVNCIGSNCSGIGGLSGNSVEIYNGSTVYIGAKERTNSWVTGIVASNIKISDSYLVMDGLKGTTSTYALHGLTEVVGASHILIRNLEATNSGGAHGLTTGSFDYYQLNAEQDYYCRTDSAADFALNPEVQELGISYFELYTVAHYGYHSNGDDTHYYGCPTDCPAAIQGESEACSGTPTCTEQAICEECGWKHGEPLGHSGGEDNCVSGAICSTCGTVYGEEDEYTHAGPYTAEYTWYSTDNVEINLYCDGCGSESSTYTSWLTPVLTETVEPTNCQTPGKSVYTVSTEIDGVTYTDAKEYPIYSYDHPGYDADGFCTACGGYQPATYNETEGVYEISNAGQLYWYAKELNENNSEIYVELTKDITIPATAPNWQPINASYAYFNGNYHTISGLKCVGTDMTYVGLFGNEIWWYEISNLHITDSYFEGGQYAGAVVANLGNGGSVTNCYVTNTTVSSSGSSVGYVIGYNIGTVSNCYTDGSVCVGYTSSYGGTVTNCFYLSETETADGGKTAEQFASGEVAYLLQAGQVGEDIWDDETGEWIGTTEPKQVWGQDLDNGKTPQTYPTFTGASVYKVLTCAEEETYSNYDQIKHGYVDGICSLCGAAEVATQVEIKISHTVSFDSDLQMNYRIKYENILAAVPNYVTEGAYLVVEKDQYLANGTTAVDIVTLYPDLTTDSTRMLFNLSGIQSVEMGSELRAVLHIFDADGKEYVTPVDAYSVLAYAELCYDSYTYAAQPKLYTMLIDALNYGSAAQVYFGRNAENPVNAGMDAYQQYATTELSAALDDVKTTVENDRTITAVTAMGFSVTFADKTEMNAKLTIADGYSKEDITCVKVLDASGNVVDTLTDFTELSDGRLQVTYYGVKSIQMRDMFYFVAYVGDQVASQNVGYSVEAYAKSNVGSTNAALAEMALNCIYYGDSAYAYFNR